MPLITLVMSLLNLDEPVRQARVSTCITPAALLNYFFLAVT